MVSGFGIEVLAREAQIVLDDGYSNCRIPEGFASRRPDHLLICIRDLHRRTQMINMNEAHRRAGLGPRK
jgi:hypothetical protein